MGDKGGRGGREDVLIRSLSPIRRLTKSPSRLSLTRSTAFSSTRASTFCEIPGFAAISFSVSSLELVTYCGNFEKSNSEIFGTFSSVGMLCQVSLFLAQTFDGPVLRR
jgi:hypothetical protein